MAVAGLVSCRAKDHDLPRVADIFARRAPMPGKSIVMAVVLSGWLIAAVVAFMIVAYARFFGIAVVGIVIWVVSARMGLEQDGARAGGVGISPGFLSQPGQTQGGMSPAQPPAPR